MARTTNDVCCSQGDHTTDRPPCLLVFIFFSQSIDTSLLIESILQARRDTHAQGRGRYS